MLHDTIQDCTAKYTALSVNNSYNLDKLSRSCRFVIHLRLLEKHFTRFLLELKQTIEKVARFGEMFLLTTIVVSCQPVPTRDLPATEGSSSFGSVPVLYFKPNDGSGPLPVYWILFLDGSLFHISISIFSFSDVKLIIFKLKFFEKYSIIFFCLYVIFIRKVSNLNFKERNNGTAYI